MPPTATTPGAELPVRAAAGVLAVVGGLALVGVWLALGAIRSGGEQPIVAREAPLGGAWDAAASFGPLSVQRVERFAGAPNSGHGHSSVGSDRIRVSLTVKNRTRAAVPFSPGQFRLRLDRLGRTLSATRPNPPPGLIGGRQTLRQRLTFLVPFPRTSFSLVFDDLGRAKPVVIALGAFKAARKS
jgi:hypothetical protein